MSRSSSFPPIRALACLVIAAASVFALAACGSSDDAQTLGFELSGKEESVAFNGPESADSGEAEISFENATKDEAELQLIRVDGDKTAEDVVEGLKAATEGKPFPDWFFAGGGIPTTQPGESKTVTQVLEPGTYYTVNVESGVPDPSSMVAIEVTGDESDEELEADATVKAAEYTFEDEGLTSGENKIAFQNVGAQPHHLIIAPIEGDATIEEVEKGFASKNGKPPIEEKGIQTAAAVIEGGESQLIDVDLKPGRYAFLCFISDRQGGPPHVTKGMVKEVDVK